MFKVFIFCVNSPILFFLIGVSFNLKDIFNITINIKNIIRLYYFILLWGLLSNFCRREHVNIKEFLEKIICLKLNYPEGSV